MLKSLPAGIYLFKFYNRNTRTRCEICSKLTEHQNDANDMLALNMSLPAGLPFNLLYVPILKLLNLHTVILVSIRKNIAILHIAFIV